MPAGLPSTFAFRLEAGAADGQAVPETGTATGHVQGGPAAAPAVVPLLADEGTYIASESSFYRVLREHGQNHRRGRARAPVRRKAPASFEAAGPCQVWTWE